MVTTGFSLLKLFALRLEHSDPGKMTQLISGKKWLSALHYFRKRDKMIINSATSNSHTLPNSNFIMGKRKKIEVQWKKPSKKTHKKVQRTLQSFQLVLHKVATNKNIQVPDEPYF